MKALVLSGGGSHGAFQVGVIKRLVELGRRWDAVYGVSVGAINALHMAMFNSADAPAAAQTLEEFWLAIRGNGDVYQGWPFGMVDVVDILMKKGSIYDTSPLERFIRARFDAKKFAESNVNMAVGTVSLRSGQIVYADKKTPGDIVKWVMGSAAFPGAFEPIEIDGDRFVDGGIRHTTPIAKAIADGATEMDVVICDPQTGETAPWDVTQAGSAVKVGIRAADIMANQVLITDQYVLDQHLLSAADSGFTFRTYSPFAPWTVDSMTFDPAAIRQMIDVGYGIP